MDEKKSTSLSDTHIFLVCSLNPHEIYIMKQRSCVTQ